MTVVTTAFTSLASEQARVLGMPDAPVAVVGHPVATLSPEQLVALADGAYADVVAKLAHPAGSEVRAGS